MLLSAGCAGGCEPPGGGVCEPSFQSQAVPTALGLASNGSYAFVAATWYYSPDPCEDTGRIGGAIHFIDLQSATPEATLVLLPFSTGRGVLVGGEFVVIQGEIGGGANPSYLVASASDLTSFELIPLAGPAAGIVGVDSEAFLLLSEQNSVLVHGSGADEAISTIANARGMTSATNRLYISGETGEVAEIAVDTRLEISRSTACANLGPVTVTTGNSILMQCRDGGLGLLGQDGSFTVSLAPTYFRGVTSEPGIDRALVSFDGPSGYETSLYVLGTGLSPESIPRKLDDDAIFGPTFAYAVAGGFPRTINLLNGESGPIPGFDLVNPDFTQLDGRFPGAIAIATGRRSFYEMHLVLVDSVTGEALGDPISIPPPDPDLLTLLE